MATRSQDFSRFFINYQKLIILIGIALTVQIFLAIRVVFWQGNWDISGDGAKGSYGNAKIHRSQQVFTEGQVTKPLDKLNENVATTQATKVETNSSSLLSSLDLDSISFVPGCDITLKDSISAINRAKTQQCKEEIANLSCDILNDSLYVKRLPRFCKNSVTKYGRYIGCFKDNPRDRILSGHISVFKEKNSPQICIDLCLQSGFQYAGLQYGVECFCGNLKPSSSLQTLEESCDLPCPVEDSLLSSTNPVLNPDDIKNWGGNCGGYFTMNVFETGVFQDYELNNKIIGLDGRREDGTLAEAPTKTVRIVFFLTLNGRSVRQVFRLIKALFQEKHFIYIHVDSRQDYLYRELQVLTHILPKNVRFMGNRKATIWGGASLLTVLLEGMEDLVANAEAWGWDWDYVINLSESDFPLKSTESLETFLSHNRGRNFVKSHGRDVQKFIQKQGLDKTFYECEHRMWRVADRKLPVGVMIDGGSDWIALHRDFVDYIIKTDDELVAGLKTVFKYTLLPAESFFHTTLRNSVHCPTFVDNNLHVTNWKRKLGCKCQYRNVVDWCGCSPNDFRLTDWNRLQLAETRIIFFGRKFEAIVNQGIINKFESWLYPYRFETHYSTLDKFWLSLYHYEDVSPKADDSLVTLGRSLARIAAERFALKYNCSLHKTDFHEEADDDQTVKLIEITAYNHDDQFQGILIRFNTQVTKNGQSTYNGVPEIFTLSLETWYQLESHVELAPWSNNIAKYRSKLQNIAVGAEYEQKEQIFRNFARSIGPFSEPVLIYNLMSDKVFNITAVFIDPSNAVQAVANSSATDSSTTMTNFIKPTLKAPLQPGMWTIKMLSVDGYLIATVKMFVLPLEIYQGKLIPLKRSLQINQMKSEFASDKKFNTEEAREWGDLRLWIDNLAAEFYSIQDFCLESEQNHLLLSKWKSEEKIQSTNGSQQQQLHGQSKSEKFKNDRNDFNDIEMDKMIETSLCSHAQWSSLFPDPKSSISGIDPDTGLLIP